MTIGIYNKWLVAFCCQLLLLAVSLLPAFPDPGAPSPASVPAQPKNTEAVTLETLQNKLAELDQRIKTSQAAENQQTALQLGVDLALLKKRTSLLKDLRTGYAWWAVTLERQTALEKDRTSLAAKVAALKERGVVEPPPYSLAFYEDLLSRLQALERQQEAYALSRSIFQENLDLLENDREKASKNWRLLQDKPAAAAPQEMNKLQFELALASLEKELAEKEYLSALTYSDLLKLLQGMVDPQVAVSREQAAWVQKHLHIRDYDLDQQLALLDLKKEEIESRRTEIQQVMQDKAKMWDQTAKEAESAEASNPLHMEISQDRQTWGQAYQNIMDCIGNRLTILEYAESLWEKRLALLKAEVPYEQALKWLKDLKSKREVGSKFFRNLGTENVYLQAQLSALDGRLDEPNLDPRIKNLLTSQRAAYQILIQEQHALMQNLVDVVQLSRRLIHEIEATLIQDPWTTFKAQLQEHFHSFMNFEIWVIDNQSVTVSKFLDALVFLIIGLFVAKNVLAYLIFPLLEKFLWRRTKAEILQKAVSYLTYTVVLLITLEKLRIPLQSFATLGGGIAIGLGFAAQTIIKNFVSGFILLGEKPFALGDLVEVGSIMGNVHDIGSRSTLLRTGENKDILVPNSYFLENSITNWTLRDRTIRTEVSVGVAYGSPVDRVEELLLQAAADCGQILQTPQPFVLLNDFGDNSLTFQVYFWIELVTWIERLKIQSTVRIRIETLFRSAGLVFAFPQRDVHLDTPVPLEVRLVDQK